MKEAGFIITLFFFGMSFAQEKLAINTTISVASDQYTYMELDRQYGKIQVKADYHFYAGNFLKALNYYERCASFKPKDEYIKGQVERLKVYIKEGLGDTSIY